MPGAITTTLTIIHESADRIPTYVVRDRYDFTHEQTKDASEYANNILAWMRGRPSPSGDRIVDADQVMDIVDRMFEPERKFKDRYPIRDELEGRIPHWINRG